MRTFGRQNIPGGVNGVGGQWEEVDTDANGFNDNVMLTTLCQAILLNLGESPFFADTGIPAVPSVQSQIPPDFYAARTQSQFAPFFASLTIHRVTGSFPPAYKCRAVCHSGAILTRTVAL